MKRSKKYQAAAAKVKQNVYTVSEAAALLPEISTSKFAGSIETSIFLSLNDKQKKETIRGSYTLPHKFGKEVKVLLFADPSYKKAGSKADVIGGEELIKQVEEGKVDYDVVVAMPMMMAKIARLGKILGTKGLMPNPKNGTVSPDPDSTIEKLKSGMKNFKLDGIRITGVIGKTDMTPAQIEENFKAFFKAVYNEIKKVGPNVIKKVVLSPTMGPSITVDIKALMTKED